MAEIRHAGCMVMEVIMRLIWICAFLLFAWVHPGAAQTADPEVRDVIARQVEALKADDFETAFGFASPGIRQIFRTPENFGAMVRNGYPMVWRPADVRFSDFYVRDGRMLQGVIFTDAGGALHVFDYEMVRIDGVWRINGVYRRPIVGA